MAVKRPVVLIYPRHTWGWEAQPWRDLPLGLLYVAAPLVAAGHPVAVLDQRTEPNWQTALQRELKRDPICVGVSSSTGPQLKHALEVSRQTKLLADVPVVWGGVHPTVLPEQTLAEDCIDIVVRGEGEQTFLELVSALERGAPLAEIPGLSYAADGRVVHNADRPFIELDSYPPPALELIDPSKYVRNVFGVERILYSTSRGCPNACSFCFNTFVHRRRWRRLSPEVAVDQLEALVATTGVGGVFLSDSNFFTDIAWAREVLQGVVRRRLNLVFTRLHVCFNVLAKMGDDDLELLSNAGCKCLAIGIESGSERIRQMLHKSIDAAQLLEVNQRMARTPLHTLYFFMMGYPDETREELAQTVALYRRLLADNRNASASLNIACPYPGTKLFDMAVRCGLQVPETTEEWARFNYRNVTDRAPWISRRRRRLIEMLDFCSFFQDGYKPYKKTSPLAALAVRLYAPIADFRVRRLEARLPVEIALAKLLGIYGKQA